MAVGVRARAHPRARGGGARPAPRAALTPRRRCPRLRARSGPLQGPRRSHGNCAGWINKARAARGRPGLRRPGEAALPPRAWKEAGGAHRPRGGGQGCEVWGRGREGDPDPESSAVCSCPKGRQEALAGAAGPLGACKTSRCTSGTKAWCTLETCARIGHGAAAASAGEDGVPGPGWGPVDTPFRGGCPGIGSGRWQKGVDREAGAQARALRRGAAAEPELSAAPQSRKP